jgi:hypothetical protein
MVCSRSCFLTQLGTVGSSASQTRSTEDQGDEILLASRTRSMEDQEDGIQLAPRTRLILDLDEVDL